MTTTEGEEGTDGFDAGAAARIFPVVYTELRRLAGRQLRRERADHTLQATALVHEAYLKLLDQDAAEFRDREHFLAVAATAMRRILVSHARRRGAAKRGGAAAALELAETLLVFERRAIDLVALDEALDALAALDARKARLVELRFFGGLAAEEAAAVLGVTTRTVERDWRLTRAWLRTRIEGEAAGN